MLNIFVSALSNFFLLSGWKFQRKPLAKPHHFTVGTLAKLVTFMIIFVATIFLRAMVTKTVAAWSIVNVLNFLQCHR